MKSKLIRFIMSGMFLLTMVGCGTPALMKVGLRNEEAYKYSIAKTTEDTVVVSYDVKVLSQGAEIKREKRWVIIPLDVIIKSDKERGSTYWLSNLKIHEGDIPEKFMTSTDLQITRLTAGQGLSTLRPVTQSMLVTYSKGNEDSSEFYYLAPYAKGKELYSHFYTSRETRNPSAYLLIAPALPFTLLYDSAAFIVASITGIDTK